MLTSSVEDLLACGMTLADPGRVLAIAARRELAPLGCVRQGRSRIWIADQRFWAIMVEFQPSGYAKGSYLNVGAHWFWHAKDHWSFDYGNRVAGFTGFVDDEQFAAAAERLARGAAADVHALRSKFSSLGDVSRVLVPWADALATAWPDYHAAVAAGLNGDVANAARLFARLAAAPTVAAWHRDLQDRGAALATRLDDARAFRARVLAIVEEARALHRLAPDPNCLGAR